MTDDNDKAVAPALSAHGERTMRDIQTNLQEFSLLLSHRCSIRALEILEIIPPGREPPPATRTQSAAIVAHPAVRKRHD